MRLEGCGDAGSEGSCMCRRMHEELKAGGEAGSVAAQVAGCVGKAVRLLAEKAEYMAATGAPTLRRLSCPLLLPNPYCPIATSTSRC